MIYKVKITREEEQPSGKIKKYTDYVLVDSDNFATAGYEVQKYFGGQGEIEDVCMMKAYKPVGNERYANTNKVFIVKFAEDFVQEDGSIKTQKYPVPFFANDNTDLQKILDLYIKQGIENMRVTTVSETKWIII